VPGVLNESGELMVTVPFGCTRIEAPVPSPVSAFSVSVRPVPWISAEPLVILSAKPILSPSGDALGVRLTPKLSSAHVPPVLSSRTGRPSSATSLSSSGNSFCSKFAPPQP